MRRLFPDFLPVPSAEVFKIVSKVSLCIGVLAICVSIVLFIIFKRADKSLIVPLIMLIAGLIMALSNIIQLLFVL